MLSRLQALQNNIRVGIIGTGSMGIGLFYQCHVTPGIECVAVADIKLEKAIECVESLSRYYRVVNNLEATHEAIRQGLVVVCEDGDLLARCEMVDVLIESSNSIGAAGRFAKTALEHRKHLILMNAEVDLAFGPYLLRLAQDNGVVYTSCDGDQHGVLKRLIDDLQLWGFQLVMAGNMKGFLNRYANPTTIVPEADKRDLDYEMATALTDGTKLNIEMSLVANGLGLSTLVPGMHGPKTSHVRDVMHLFDLNAIWDGKQPVVDYILNAEPDGGIFAIGFCDNKYQKKMLSYYKMGDGPFYLFYRPYHLCHIEALTCVAEAFLDGRPLLQPTLGLQTNVFTYAKRGLQKGETLDGIGGYTCYGLIENCPQTSFPPGLPICLADNVTLKHDVAKDEKILLADVDYEPTSFEFELYYKALENSSPVTS